MIFAQFLVFLMGSFSAHAQAPFEWQTGFQIPATPVMQRIVEVHNFVFYIMVAIVLFVFVMLLIIVLRYRASRNPIPSQVTHNTPLEIIWTIVPVIIVLIIAVPSLRLQFFMARIQDPELTIKVVGHQWYWEYIYPDHKIEFESRMIPSSDLSKEQIRLLSVDKPVVIPSKTNVRILTTSQDVIHSWAVPAFGVKKDTVPGRLNETWVRVDKEGVYYGQCSELCGADHGFMPIEVHVVSKAHFEQWLLKNKQPEVSSAAPLAKDAKSLKDQTHGT